MANKDQATELFPTLGYSITTSTDTTAVVGNVIDTQLYSSITFEFIAGTVSASDTITFQIEEGDAVDSESAPTDITDYAAVSDDFLITQTSGTAPEAAATLSASNTVTKIGYVGKKRYVRVRATPTGSSISIVHGCVVQRGNKAYL
jgi:hypothetical protein